MCLFVRIAKDSHKCSHLISGGTRTLKVLFALANNSWILKPEWVHVAAQQGEWPPEEEFACENFPGMRKPGTCSYHIIYCDQTFICENAIIRQYERFVARDEPVRGW